MFFFLFLWKEEGESSFFFFFQAEDGIRDFHVTGVQTCALPICAGGMVNRGFLRAYPERTAEIAATVQIAAPNTGLISHYIANMLKLMWIPHQVIDDLDVASDFLTWM